MRSFSYCRDNRKDTKRSGGIEAVSDILREYEDELTADFKRFFNIRCLDIWRGDYHPHEVMSYIKALLRYPESLYRETYFERAEYDPKNDNNNSKTTWYGWGNLEILLGQFINLYAISHTSEKNKKSLIKSPPITLPSVNRKNSKGSGEIDDNAMEKLQQDFLKAMKKDG